MEAVIAVLLWSCAIGCGVVAGVFFAFSTFVMRALGDVAPGAGIAAMNAINRVILRSAFMPLFLGTTLAAAVLCVLALLEWEAPGAQAMFAGGIAYVVGMFVATVVFNVPLNDALGSAERDADGGQALWARYLVTWTRWNHVRALASIVACGLFVLALVQRAQEGLS
jgi:uncharacterized membrane protein